MNMSPTLIMKTDTKLVVNFLVAQGANIVRMENSLLGNVIFRAPLMGPKISKVIPQVRRKIATYTMNDTEENGGTI